MNGTKIARMVVVGAAAATAVLSGTTTAAADPPPVTVSDGTFVTSDATGTTVVELLAPPPDATLTDAVPDPNAPEPNPTDGWVETDTNVPSGVGTVNCQSYGSATWLEPQDELCPPVHWLNGYFYVNNVASSTWPVQAEAAYWNGSAADVGYGCHTAYHCVRVMDGHYGGTGWVGLTSYRYDQFHRFVSVSVQYNDSYLMTPAEKTEATCHELGHVTGLGHETSNTSCMNPVDDGTHTSASNDDFRQLEYHTYNGTT